MKTRESRPATNEAAPNETVDQTEHTIPDGTDRPARRTGFAMVPAWLVDMQPSPAAVFVYVHLALFGTFHPGSGRYEQCRPALKTLTDGDPKRGYPGTGLNIKTVRRAIAELEALGALVCETAYDKRGARLPNVYRLVFGELSPECAGGVPKNGMGGVVPKNGTRVVPKNGTEGVPKTGTQPITQYLEPDIHTSSPHPLTDTGTASAVPDAKQVEEEATTSKEEPSNDTRRAASALVAALPAVGGQQISLTLAARLTEGVATLLAAGWTAEDIRAELTDGTATAVSPGIYDHRLRALPATPPPPRADLVPAAVAAVLARVQPSAVVSRHPTANGEPCTFEKQCPSCAAGEYDQGTAPELLRKAAGRTFVSAHRPDLFARARPSTTDQRVADTLALADMLEAQEQAASGTVVDA